MTTKKTTTLTATIKKIDALMDELEVRTASNGCSYVVCDMTKELWEILNDYGKTQEKSQKLYEKGISLRGSEWNGKKQWSLFRFYNE